MYSFLRRDDINVDEIINNIDINKYKKWKHFLSTNCYAYALGLDLNENKIKDYAYQPGVISGYNYPKHLNFFLYSTLIKGLYADMEKLGILIKKVDLKYKVEEDEWKIALFTSKVWSNRFELLRDFHFLRQVDDGTWYHKMGYFAIPNNKDNNHKVITNPQKCYIKDQKYRDCYCLKLKK